MLSKRDDSSSVQLCPPSLPFGSFPLAMGRQLLSAEFFKQH